MFRKLHEIEKNVIFDGLGGLGRPLNPPMVRENWIISRQYVLTSKRFFNGKVLKKQQKENNKKNQKKTPKKCVKFFDFVWKFYYIESFILQDTR